jgi:hypothetical protein
LNEIYGTKVPGVFGVSEAAQFYSSN